MKRCKRMASAIMAAMLAILGCGCSTQEISGDPNGNSEIESNIESNTESNAESDTESDATEPGDKRISLSLWENPGLEDRPMVMMHSVGTKLIDDVFERGYGGVVTNVGWGDDYLRNDRAFSLLAGGVEHAVNKGMHVWIYDEYGYPSGTAFGQVLKDNPEYEALGLVASYEVVPSGSKKTINLLYGHKEIVAAYIYDGNSKESMDISSADNVSSLISSDRTSVSYTNRSAGDKVLVAYMSKRWYENTHSMENWYVQQRYINMLDAEPAQKFISLTHEKYYENLSKYFGNGIQAFFTDEPALQGNYFEISERSRKVLDEADPLIEVIECLNYSDKLFDKFKAAYGYDLKPYLAYLYNDDGSVKAKQVRIDFYALTGELFRSNYLEQIENWCKGKGVTSSGHLLLEEDLYQNVWFAGNMLQLLGSMGIPGTDLLYSEPLGAINAACVTSKLAASAAEYTGKSDTFAEISGAFDGTKGDIYDQINAVGVQICMGVNTFASYYYQGGNHTKDEDLILSTALGRMRYMTTGVAHRAKTAVYYPYEGASAETLPTKNLWNATESAKTVSDGFRTLCKTLAGKQVDYDLVDNINLRKCTIKGDKLVSPNGEEYSSIVIPYTTALCSDAVLKLIQAVNAGVKVVVIGVDEIVCETGKNSVAGRWGEVLDKAKYVTTENGAANYLRDNGGSYVKLSDAYAENIFTSKRENANYSVFTFVNAYEEDKSYDIELYASGKAVKYYNPVTGLVTDVKASFKNGATKFNFTLPANTTGFFVIEK